MAIAFDNSAVGSAASGTSATFSLTVSGSNRILIVGVVLRSPNSASGPSSVTYNGVSLTQIAVIDISFMNLSLWRLVNPSTGANNVVVTNGATSSNIAATAVSYTGVNQTTPLGTATSNSASSASSMSTTVSSNSGELVVDTGGTKDTTSAIVAAGAGQTQRAATSSNADSNGVAIYASEKAGATSVTMTADRSVGSNRLGVIAVPLKPVPDVSFVRWIGALE